MLFENARICNSAYGRRNSVNNDSSKILPNGTLHAPSIFHLLSLVNLSYLSSLLVLNRSHIILRVMHAPMPPSLQLHLPLLILQPKLHPHKHHHHPQNIPEIHRAPIRRGKPQRKDIQPAHHLPRPQAKQHQSIQTVTQIPNIPRSRRLPPSHDTIGHLSIGIVILVHILPRRSQKSIRRLNRHQQQERQPHDVMTFLQMPLPRLSHALHGGKGDDDGEEGEGEGEDVDEDVDVDPVGGDEIAEPGRADGKGDEEPPGDGGEGAVGYPGGAVGGGGGGDLLLGETFGGVGVVGGVGGGG
mmetsp:Transcript_11494/g.23472  ORF Transcript_11494/g.23472 Transcript_11494/m.23472 type:complete len:299 (+) Transcript_11494:163-1059(+)